MAVDPLESMLIGGPDRCTYVCSLLTGEERARLQQVLKFNTDVFAWTHSDMTGISPMNTSHKLNVLSSARPIQQRIRGFHPDRHQIIQAKVDNLLKARFIREFKYPKWFANVVVVPKKGGKWRVCVDYTDINDACPKDRFPFPCIDKIVDASTVHGMLSFLDAFSGYHQIPMYGKVFYHPSQAFLLQPNAIRVKKCRSHLLETGNQDVLAATRKNYGNI